MNAQKMKNPRVLVIGANGQLGSVLTTALQVRYGEEQVVASDLFRKNETRGTFELLDATDFDQLRNLVVKYEISQIYHLAAILSAKGESEPLRTWEINMKALLNVLEVARLERIQRVFYPSSIAVFGPDLPLRTGAQYSFLNPYTVYGMSKAAGENWCQYYFQKYGVDVRSLRYPGVIGYQSLPGGGTTDYAVDIFHKAIAGQAFNCFLAANTLLPMIFMEDAIRATLELMEAPADKISIRTSYNLAGMSFTPAELASEIRSFKPDFDIIYQPDFRQQIAESWPGYIDDRYAREDWGWKPEYSLQSLTESMIFYLKSKNEPTHV